MWRQVKGLRKNLSSRWESNHDLPYTSRTLYHWTTGMACDQQCDEVTILGYGTRAVSHNHLNK